MSIIMTDVTSKRDVGFTMCSFFFFFFAHFYFPASGQAVVTGVVPSPLPVLAFNFYRA